MAQMDQPPPDATNGQSSEDIELGGTDSARRDSSDSAARRDSSNDAGDLQPQNVGDPGVPPTPQNGAPRQMSIPSQDAHSSNTYHEWKSKWLKLGTLIPMSSVTVVIIGGIITLCIVSHNKKGLASVPENETLVLSFELGLAILWTFLPVLFFQVYGALVSAIVKAAAVRQPFIELRENPKDPDRGASAETSVLLDYQSDWTPYASYKAFRNKHYLLSFSFAVAVLLNFGLTPIASHLFDTEAIEFGSPVIVRQEHAFDEDALVNHKTSITPVMGVVSSTLIYGGDAIPWTSFRQAFIPFSLPQSQTRPGSSRNITVATHAYSVEANCVILGPNDFELKQAENKLWYYNIRDRGCSQSNQHFEYDASPLYTDFIRFTSNLECPFKAGLSRVYIVAAFKNGDSKDLVHKTAVSCAPSYYKSRGLLSVYVGAEKSAAPTIQNFIQEQRELIGPFPNFGLDFEAELTQGISFDNAATVLANAFGSLILDYAKKLSPENYRRSDILLNATSTLFTAAYPVMTKLYLVQPSSAQEIEGTLHIISNRLVVVQPVAYSILGILFFVLLTLAGICRYSKKNKSVLYNEPKTLLGWARILVNSRLIEWLQEAVSAERLRATELNSLFLADFADEEWLVRKWELPKLAALVPKGYATA